MSGSKNYYKFSSDHKSIKFKSYSGTYVPGVLSCDENCATEEHGQSNSASYTEVSEGDIIGQDYSEEYYDIMYEDLDVGEETRADSLGLQLSTKEFIKYEIT